MNWIDKKKECYKEVTEELKKKNRESEIEKRRSTLLNQPSTSQNPLSNSFNFPSSPSSSDDMDQDITPAQAKQLFQELREEIASLRLNQAQAQPAQVPVVTRSRTRQEMIMDNFLNKPMQVHHQLNPRKPVLAYEGTNFPSWEAAIDRTLCHILVRQEPFTTKLDNFALLSVEEASTVASLMRNTIVDTLGDIIDASKMSSPKEIFELLRTKCSRSDQSRKIELLNQLVQLVNDPLPASDATLSVWAKLNSKLSELKITWDEALGIFLQSHFKPPIGVEPMTFEFTISQQLNEKEAPPFDDVMTILQFASNKLRNKTGGPMPTLLPSVPDPMAMDLDRIQALQHQPRYVAPQRRAVAQPARQPTTLSLEKATHFKGKGQSESLVKKHGSHCIYCGEDGHWYADCCHFWKDVATGKISPPDADYNEKNSKYRPPPRPEGNRLRQVNIPDVSDGVLLDSGASAHCDDTYADGTAED